MKKDIDILELFSGIGGFTKGFQDAGYNIKNHYFSEIDKHAIANYKYNFKNAKSIGSVTDVQGFEHKADVITFGSPCQDFSLAGKRMGMAGQRSSLIGEAIRLVTEIRPAVFVWENVKGAFSSNNGEDFWAIIAAFTNIGGYRLEWQLCNTSWFLPQNRERIYLIGHLAGRSGPGVFPFTENGGLLNKPYDAKKGWPQTQNSSTIGAGSLRADDTFIELPKKAGCLTGGGNSGGLHSDMTVVKVKQVNDLKNFGNSTKQQDRLYDTTGLMCCISSSRTESKVNIVSKNEKNEIRRLTEIECERLQGFPDDWTKFGNYDGEIKEIVKTQRYKMCGNAVTTSVVKAIAERLRID